VEARAWLEQIERDPALDALASLAFLASRSIPIDEHELNAARRRAVLLLATGGDPARALDADGRAVRVLAADLDAPERRARLAAALEDLRGQAEGLVRVLAELDRLLADGELAWRSVACALLAEDLAGGDE
jgi:hypothetical protein